MNRESAYSGELLCLILWLPNLWLRSIFHVRVFWLSGLLGLLLCLQPRFDLGTLLRLLFLLLLQNSLSLCLDFVEVALYDGSCNRADFFDLGDIDGLCGILTFVVEPVL
jgi:hypothetical protein